MILGLKLLVLLFISKFAIALEVPENTFIFEVNSKVDSHEGYVMTATHQTSKDYHYLPINIFSHIDYSEYFDNDGEWIQDINERGISSVSTSGAWRADQKMEVCFDKPVPVNSRVILLDSGGDQVQDIDIPSYRSDRMCINVDYYSSPSPEGIDSKVTEFVLIFD